MAACIWRLILQAVGGEVLPRLLNQVEESLCQTSGDGAYDHNSCYEALRQRGEEQGFPEQGE